MLTLVHTRKTPVTLARAAILDGPLNRFSDTLVQEGTIAEDDFLVTPGRRQRARSVGRHLRALPKSGFEPSAEE